MASQVENPESLERYQVRKRTVEMTLALIGSAAFVIGGCFMLISDDVEITEKAFGALAIIFFGWVFAIICRRVLNEKRITLAPEGIYYAFPPNIGVYKLIRWDDIESFTILKLKRQRQNFNIIRLHSYKHLLDQFSEEEATKVVKIFRRLMLIGNATAVAGAVNLEIEEAKDMVELTSGSGSISNLAELFAFARSKWGGEITLAWPDRDMSADKFDALLKRWHARYARSTRPDSVESRPLRAAALPQALPLSSHQLFATPRRRGGRVGNGAGAGGLVAAEWASQLRWIIGTALFGFVVLYVFAVGEHWGERLLELPQLEPHRTLYWVTALVCAAMLVRGTTETLRGARERSVVFGTLAGLGRFRSAFSLAMYKLSTGIPLAMLFALVCVLAAQPGNIHWNPNMGLSALTALQFGFEELIDAASLHLLSLFQLRTGGPAVDPPEFALAIWAFKAYFAILVVTTLSECASLERCYREHD